MTPGLRSFLIILGLALGFALWLVSGQYRPADAPAGEGKADEHGSRTVWSAESPRGDFWGNEDRKVIERQGKGTPITIRFDGPGWRGCGVNWKGWYPADACDDMSAYRSLVFSIRQVTNVADADLTVHLVDNVPRSTKTAVGNGISVLGRSGLSRIDGEWRHVVLPLEQFAAGTDLNLKRLWGINFSDSSGRAMTFQIDQIGFSNESPPIPSFPPAPAYSATATVFLDRPGHAIHHEIYGVADLPPEKLAELRVPIVRWGGNRSSRYNWRINADAAGSDWFFKNGGHRVDDPAQGGWSKILQGNVSPYVTVPTLGFVARDHHSYAFSVQKYGRQRATEMGHPDVGNGVLPDGRPVTGNDWRDTSVEAGPEFVADGVRLVVKLAGRPDRVRYWALDNEPMLWHETHRDVRPKSLGYDELWERTVQYAEAIKQADPSAKVAGFCSWGWTDLWYSAADEGHDKYSTKPDYHAHGRMPLAEWFIKKCGDYKREHGKALVDIFDFHWYPQAELSGRTPYKGTGMEPKFNQLRLRTTGDLWDPDYKPESWVKHTGDGKPTALLRRVRAWIEQHNPGMEVCVGEYNFGGGDNMTGALAQADVFGILARERADLAFIWTRPEGTQELSWKLFRNYDGDGGRFGDRYIPSETNSTDVAIYAARRSTDGATTVVVLNKNLGGPCTLKLGIPGLKGPMRVWRFDQQTAGKVVESEQDAKTVHGEISLTVPAASGTMLVIE